jgi:hypothetical protein
MGKHKIDGLLKALEPAERKAFVKFLTTGYFNTNQSFHRAFHALCRLYPDGFHRDAIDWASVYQRTFLKPAPNAHALENLRSSLHHLLEDFFIIQESLGKTPGDGCKRQRSELLSRALSKRHAFEALEAEAFRFMAKADSLPYRDADDYLVLHQIQHSLLSHPFAHKFKPGWSGAESSMHNLDVFFVLTKLEYMADAANRRKFLAEKPLPVRLFEAIRQIVETDTSLPVAAKIYLEIIQLHSAKHSDAHYCRLKNWLLQDLASPTVSHHQQREVFYHLVNFAIHRYDKGDAAFLPEQYELYRLGHERALLLDNGKLSESTFTNAVVAGTAMKELTWTENFIRTSLYLLDDNRRHSAAYFAEAHLLFHRGEHELLDEKFRDIPPMPLQHGFRLHLLRIRNYYECIRQGKITHKYLESLCTAYAQRMKHSKALSQEKKDGYRLFVRYLARLIQNRTNLETLKQLRQDTQEHQRQFILKNWLAEKIEEAIDDLTVSSGQDK